MGDWTDAWVKPPVLLLPYRHEGVRAIARQALRGSLDLLRRKDGSPFAPAHPNLPCAAFGTTSLAGPSTTNRSPPCLSLAATAHVSEHAQTAVRPSVPWNQ